MKNNKGSVLTATLAFILIFTMLGIATINMGGMHNEFTGKEVFSAKAFWLADGGIDKVRADLPNLNAVSYTAVSTDPYGTASYNATIAKHIDPGPPSYTYTFLWDADSQATVINQNRRIKATIDGSGINSVIKTGGEVKSVAGNCLSSNSATTDCSKVEQNTPFTFASYFPTLTLPVLPDYVDNMPASFSGLKYVKITNNFTSPSIVGSGFIYINITNSSANLTINLGNFSGIIWIAGQTDKVSFQGNPDIQGSIFVENLTETKFAGNGTFTFDPVAIDKALDEFCTAPPCVPPGKPVITCWNEDYTSNTCQ